MRSPAAAGREPHASPMGGGPPAVERAARFALSGRLRLLLLGALLVIGIVGMHSLLPPPAHGTTTSAVTGAPAEMTSSAADAAVLPAMPDTAGSAAEAGGCHSGHSGGADHGSDGGSCGSHHLLMLCAAILIAFASLVIALALMRGRLTQALYVVQRWTRAPGTLVAHQLFSGPLTPREVTCVHRC